jgi:hypothetical protein
MTGILMSRAAGFVSGDLPNPNIYHYQQRHLRTTHLHL